jgi:iron complex transport system substrate-binding protein
MPASRRSAVALLLLVFLCAASSAARAGSYVVRDDLQRDIRFTESPLRIISLLPSLTETVCALGACDRLVATDRFSDWPAQVRGLPKAGGLDDVSIETLVSLRPDLILISRSQRVTQRLRDLGIRTFAVTTQSYADIGQAVALLGRILGVEDRAAQLAGNIDREVREIGAAEIAHRARDGAASQGATVYVEVDRGPYAAGPTSFIGELLTRLGTRNIVSADLGDFPKLNPEYVVRHNPDVIFIAAAEAAHLAERPGWNAIRAVREQRLCTFPPEVRDTVVRPGPRVPDGMRALAACLDRFGP